MSVCEALSSDMGAPKRNVAGTLAKNSIYVQTLYLRHSRVFAPIMSNRLLRTKLNKKDEARIEHLN